MFMFSALTLILLALPEGAVASESLNRDSE
jgi:hypothetical protein